MAVNFNVFHKFMELWAKGTYSFDFDAGGDTIKCSMHLAAYSPTQATDEDFADTTNEVTGTNYTAGGATITSPTVSAGANVDYDGADVVFTGSASGFTAARRAVLYKDSGVAATSPLILFSDDFGADKGNNPSDLTLAWNANGLLRWAQ